VASERNGVWGKAIEVPGLRALNQGMSGGVESVSCASAGNCAAGGDYEDRGQNGHGFVVGEKNGVWGKAIEVLGLFDGDVGSMSCAAPGNCAAGGEYGEGYPFGFVVSEKNGVWGKAIDVPGLGALTGRFAGVNSVSCASPGDCAAGGYYSDTSGGVTQGFLAVERNGRWAKAIKVPGLVALNTGGGAGVSSVSCARAGTCAAVGSYAGRHQDSQGFVVSQTGQGG
jgi:hypothetical protein